MSASLVGSEMCIRDRRRPASWPARSARSRRAFAPASAPLLPTWAPWLSAVSYTHLTLPTICSV
eukprot:6361699-Alexandrium_andersonii.AAC.1